jgi:hypothetical protein
MPSKFHQQTTGTPTAADATAADPPTSGWQGAREHLERLKAHIAGQINAYPPPIPACDAQFNYLLEQRGSITDELNKLEAARNHSLNRADGMAALKAFLACSEFVDEAAARKIESGRLL